MKDVSIYVGLKFGRITVERFSYRNKAGMRFFECKCDCGNSAIIFINSLLSGDTKSCGCLHKEISTRVNTKHGNCKRGNTTTEYRIWSGIKRRCLNPKSDAYKNYGGRGISICERWQNSFENFLADMGNRPSLKHTLDRYPDVNGNYELSNCRWATRKEQARNMRTNKFLEYGGVRMIMQDWCNAIGICHGTIQQHLKVRTFHETINYYKIKRGNSFLKNLK